MNLSSIVVLTTAEHLEEMVQTIQQSEFCEYHLHDEKGRIIVTIEGDGIEQEIVKLQQIQALPHVLSAEMVFSYSEDELEREKDKLEKNDTLPEWLNDPDAKMGDINYGGSLKGRF